MRTTRGRRWKFGNVSFLALALGASPSVLANEPGAKGGGASGHGSLAEVGAKLSDPLSDVWALFTEFNHTWSDGDITNENRTATHVIFQPIMPFKLTSDFKLITRPTLPLFYNADVPDGLRRSPDHSVAADLGGVVKYDDQSGMGDLSVPLLLTPEPKPGQRWGFGAGPTFVFPTATDDTLGTDTWEIGPAAVVTYKTKKVSAAVLGQYWWDYAKEGDAEDTSHGSILYSVWWNLPNAWQVGFNPTITYNDEAFSDNQWNVPVGLGVAKTIKIGKVPVKFQLSAEKSVVRQDILGKEWNIRLNVIPVIPALVKNPIFQ